ncbi:MAG: NAD(+) synthase [Treponema sp.]|nr:NAD(+) synthase [Treponema sp.]
MNYGFLRVATVSPEVVVADCKTNAKKIIEQIKLVTSEGASLIVFPELAISGKTCGDLFFQSVLLEEAWNAVLGIGEETSSMNALICVGFPFKYENSLYNCAAVLHYGKVLAIIPQVYGNEIFSSFNQKSKNRKIYLPGLTESVIFGTNIIFQDAQNKNFSVAVEIGQDLFSVFPPSIQHCAHGAAAIANLCGISEIAERKRLRLITLSSHSSKLNCACIYVENSWTESTTDCVYSAHNIVAENGKVLKQSKLYGGGYIIVDVDFEKLINERRKKNTFAKIETNEAEYDIVQIIFSRRHASLKRNVKTNPFVPQSKNKQDVRFSEIINMQSHGLAKRLMHIQCKNAVLGLSGGLDSTLALLITVEAFKILRLDLSGIIAVTMPCFGTSKRTYTNACNLAKALNVSLREINIEKAVMQHFADIGHDQEKHDITYENSQARERTQVLMDVANQCNGLVIGTGDLSELALGWTTYNGDHMSMYAVNASVPKTLVRYLVQYFATGDLEMVLKDILDTPVSPELLPTVDGTISQKTEEFVGPYELHDFFLYYFIRFGFSPKKIFFMAQKAFDGIYEKETIKKWLKFFCKRFFLQQFKRSCMPDSIAVGSVNLSPRNAWKMPSDASATLWLNELD